MKIKRPFQEGDGQPLCVALALSLRCAVGVNHHKRAITRTKNQEEQFDRGLSRLSLMN